MIRALRIQDWSVQVLIHWACALVYALVTSPPPLPYFVVLVWTTAHVAGTMTAGYLLNNVADYRADALKPRPYFGDPREVVLAAVLGCALLLVTLSWVHSVAESLWLPLIAWGQLAIGLGYSLPPIRFKERGVLGLLTPAASQRLPAFLLLVAAAPVFDPWAMGLLAGWLMLVGLLFILEHQLEDLDADRRSGTRTWMTAAGRERGVRLRDLIYRLLAVSSIMVAAFVAVRVPTVAGLLAAVLCVLGGTALSASIRRHYARLQGVGDLAPPSERGTGTVTPVGP